MFFISYESIMDALEELLALLLQLIGRVILPLPAFYHVEVREVVPT